MGHQQAYLAAVDGKHRGNRTSGSTKATGIGRRLLPAAAILFAASVLPASVKAQSGPFAGMAGNWAGGGSVTLDDGSKERIRCRATYAVAGVNMTMTLTCASNSYKFVLSANVAGQGGAVTGTWSEFHPQHQRHPPGPRRRRQFRGGGEHGRLQRQHLPAHSGSQAVDQHPRGQPVPRRLDRPVALGLADVTQAAPCGLGFATPLERMP